MKAIFSIAAIVVVIATTNAYVPEYDKENAYVYSSADPEAEVSTAELFNADAELKFKVGESDDEVNLVADPVPDASQITGGGCGRGVGIHVTNVGKTFCNLTNFYLAVVAYEEEYSGEENARDAQEQVLQLGLYFNNQDEPFLLETPVFKIPAEFASASQKELEKWAQDNEVGILSPVDVEKLKIISEKGEWEGNFKWLSELLTYGIVTSEDSYQVSETETEVLAYSTQPVVLRGEEIDKFIEVVEENKKKNNKK